MNKKKLENHEEGDHESIINFENLFQRHEQRNQLIVKDEYYGDFDNIVYNKISMGLYSPPIFDVCFDDEFVNNDSMNNDNDDNDEVMNSVLVDKLRIKCKENMKDA